jgi:hypothetical protein
MPFFVVTPDCLSQVPETTFAAAGIRERADLQRLLRAQIDIVAKDTLVIAEEFGDWEGSSRRIDLLGLDKDANLVVIELKRTEDGGHMDLQALRYAAMVSTMTFEKVEEVYGDYLRKLGKDADSRSAILEFLGWEEAEEHPFAQAVKIILVSAEFSKEITTAVLWLNEQGLDIRCVRIKPYADNGRVLVDIQQIIPLPEAAGYIVNFKKKQERDKVARESPKDLTKYDITVAGTPYPRLNKRMAIFQVVKYLCDSGVTPEAIIGKVNGLAASRLRFADASLHTQKEFTEWQKAQEATGGKPFAADRYFCRDTELIRSGGKTWALSNQWGTQTYEVICELIKAFSDKKITCTPSI